MAFHRLPDGANSAPFAVAFSAECRGRVQTTTNQSDSAVSGQHRPTRAVNNYHNATLPIASQDNEDVIQKRFDIPSRSAS